MTTALGILILLAVGVGAVYVIFRPQFALVLVLTLFPLKQLIQSYLPTFAVNSPAFNFLIFGVVVVAVAARILRRDGAFSAYLNRVSVLTLLLYGFALFGVLYTPAREAATELVLDGAPYWLMMVILLPLAIVTLDDVRKALPAFMVIGTIICILVLLNPTATFHSGRLMLDIGGAVGIQDLRGSPLITATMGAQVALVAILLRPERHQIVFNVLRIAAIIAGLGLAVASGSRGNAVFAAIIAIAFFPLARRVADIRQFFVNAAAFLILVGAVVMSFRFFLGQDIHQQARWDVTRWHEPIVQDRLVPIGVLMEAYLSSPMHWLFGLGTNAYSHVHAVDRGYAHNLVFEMLAEHGLFGLGLLTLITVLAYRLGRDLWRLYAHDPLQRSAAATLLGLCVYTLFLSMKEGSFVALPMMWTMWVIMAKVSTHERAFWQRQLEYEWQWAQAADGAEYDDDETGGERLALG